jgi:uncharacterized protein (TIGR00106 family)
MVLLEFAMFPTDKGGSVSPYVAKIIDVIDKSGVTYKLTPMGTILEGEWDEVMSVVGKCFKTLEADCDRVYSSIKIDYRKVEGSRMTTKTGKIQSILDRPINV